jgi:hypothetical protein
MSNYAFLKEEVHKLCCIFKLKCPTRCETIGVYGELLAYAHYQNQGRKVEYTPRGKYDLLVDGIRVEVKTAIKNNIGKYSFIWSKNMTNGVLNFDWLMVVLLDSPLAKPVFVEISPKSIKKRTALTGRLEKIKEYGRI